MAKFPCLNEIIWIENALPTFGPQAKRLGLFEFSIVLNGICLIVAGGEAQNSSVYSARFGGE